MHLSQRRASWPPKSIATDWQRADVAAVLSGDPLMAFLTRPRGASKTTDLGAVGLAVLTLQAPTASRSYAVAADADQAGLLVDAMRRLARLNPTLQRVLRVDARRVVNLQTGASLEVLPADAPSAWGLLPHLVIVDEVTQWPGSVNHRGVWDAVVSAVAKVDGCRLVCLTSAGDPVHWSHRVLEHARTSPRWRVNEVPGPCPWISEDALAEQRALLTDSQYARLHLNRWVAAEDRLVSAEALRDAVVLDGPQEPRLGVTYRIGADLGLRHDRTAIAVCHAEPVTDRVPPSRRVVLDRMVVLAGTRQREVLDPWQGIGLAQRLRARGVTVVEQSFTPQVYGRMASVLYTLLRDRLLAIYMDDGLLDELANVRLRETLPGLLRVDHDPGRHDDRPA